MLTQHPAIQPALVKCHTENLQRLTIEGPRASRFRAVVDDEGSELGAVSSRFRAVQTADVVAAFDLVADRFGVDLEPRDAFYHNGRAKFSLDMPGRTLRTTDRDGGITPMLLVQHGLGGRGGLQVYSGGRIHICSNGLVSGIILNIEYARHTKGIDVEQVVVRALSKLDESIDRDFRLIEAAKRERFDFTGDLMRQVGTSAPQRLRDTFKGIIRENRTNYSDTVWALLQSITELSTHHMRERRDGSHVWSADDWSRQQVARVVREYELVG